MALGPVAKSRLSGWIINALSVFIGVYLWLKKGITNEHKWTQIWAIILVPGIPS